MAKSQRPVYDAMSYFANSYRYEHYDPRVRS